MISLIKGSIFDSKCDLVIIPCDSIGGVTRSISKELMLNDIPYPHNKMEAGDVHYIQYTGGFANASMLGYAASVDAETVQSSAPVLRSIMKNIKQCCQYHSLQKVNIPLLGTGAGGLSAKVSYEIMKEEFGSDRNILLCIYVLTNSIYNELFDESALLRERNTIRNPRVFISYTGIDIENRNWVKDFACRLRQCGVNARIDIFHLKPGQDLPQWMTNELLMADKVLLICDKYYAEKADDRKGGVGWETMIIQGDMLSKPDQNKYIAIQREKDINKSLPIYVKSKYALNWTDDSQMDKDFDELLLHLFDCDIEPPLGDVPSFVKEKLVQ